MPEINAPFVATTEFVCGALLVLGLGTRLAAIPLIVLMLVAITTAFLPKLAEPYLANFFYLSESASLALRSSCGSSSPAAAERASITSSRRVGLPDRAKRKRLDDVAVIH